MITTVADIQARFYRPLSATETTTVEARIADAETMIRARLSDFDDRLQANPLFPEIVKRVVADAVIRVIHNPEGLSREQDGNYSYERETDPNRGRLVITPEDWSDLGLRRGIAIIPILPKLPGSLQ